MLNSLEETVDPEAEEKWTEMMAHRIDELDSGEVVPIPWSSLSL